MRRSNAQCKYSSRAQPSKHGPHTLARLFCAAYRLRGSFRQRPSEKTRDGNAKNQTNTASMEVMDVRERLAFESIEGALIWTVAIGGVGYPSAASTSRSFARKPSERPPGYERRSS